MRRLSTLALAALAAAALASCGRDREPASELRFEPSQRTAAKAYPEVGMRLRVPRNLFLRDAPAPGVFRGFVGNGFLAAFAYRRKEQLPRNRRELDAARRRLERAAKKRSPSYELRRSRATRVAGARAIELVGDQEISEGRLRTRSLHVFDRSAEYVIELAVPVDEFERLDPAIFSPIRRSLRVTGEVPARRSG